MGNKKLYTDLRLGPTLDQTEREYEPTQTCYGLRECYRILVKLYYKIWEEVEIYQMVEWRDLYSSERYWLFYIYLLFSFFDNR